MKQALSAQMHTSSGTVFIISCWLLGKAEEWLTISYVIEGQGHILVNDLFLLESTVLKKVIVSENHIFYVCIYSTAVRQNYFKIIHIFFQRESKGRESRNSYCN